MKWWAETPAARKAVRAEVEPLLGDFSAATAGPCLRAWRHYRYRLAVTLLAGGRAFAAEARRRARVLSYADLLTIAARVLRENPAVRRALGSGPSTGPSQRRRLGAGGLQDRPARPGGAGRPLR